MSDELESQSVFETGQNGVRCIPGNRHVIPLDPCPMCGSPSQFVEHVAAMVWMGECTKCGLLLGMPYGYASRLGLCDDWNRRTSLTP